VTSKDIDRLLRKDVWPRLREHGFLVRGRTARRYWPDAVDVVNFQSYSGHQATVHGITSFSFQVNLGMWPTFLPGAQAMRRDERGRALVNEYECLLRHHVEPTLAEPPRKRSLNPFAFRPLPKPTATWAVAPDGGNARECVLDAARAIEAQALPWFGARRTAEQLIAVARAEFESPWLEYVIGFAAARAGDRALARENLERALSSGAFPEDAGDLRDALAG
jgi:hypothetical protein